MNNERPPSWKFEEVVTINCEFSLFGLMDDFPRLSILFWEAGHAQTSVQYGGVVFTRGHVLLW